MRILIVEDDEKIAEFIRKGLEQWGYAVDHALDGEEAHELFLQFPYDAAIVDIMLPKMDGLSLIDRIREKGIEVPVLILSAKRSVDDRIEGLRRGGDDYLVKPFSFSELLARIQALIRRSTRQSRPTGYSVGDLSVDLLKREVMRAGKKIELQPMEFKLLEYLLRNLNRIVTKTMILEHVWNYNFDPQTNVVDVLVHRLRNKIDKDFDVKLIQTIRGVGYVLRTPEAKD
jgi:DNA-binding response OmpR family regulator